jgi:hypothetical protein
MRRPTPTRDPKLSTELDQLAKAIRTTAASSDTNTAGRTPRGGRSPDHSQASASARPGHSVLGLGSRGGTCRRRCSGRGRRYGSGTAGPPATAPGNHMFSWLMGDWWNGRIIGKWQGEARSEKRQTGHAALSGIVIRDLVIGGGIEGHNGFPSAQIVRRARLLLAGKDENCPLVYFQAAIEEGASRGSTVLVLRHFRELFDQGVWHCPWQRGLDRGSPGGFHLIWTR